MVVSAGVIGGLTALQLGSQFLQQFKDQQEAQSLQDQIDARRTSPEGIRMQEALERLDELSKNLPQNFRQSMTSRAQSAAANRRNRLNRSLARSGFTAGSEVAQRGQRGLIQDLISSRADIGLQAGQLESQLGAQQFNLNQQASKFFDPLDTTESSFVDPFSALTPLLLLGRGGGGGTGSGTGGGLGSNPLAPLNAGTDTGVFEGGMFDPIQPRSIGSTTF